MSSSVAALGTATTAASSTAGCSMSSFSTSKLETFSPRRRIASLVRSTNAYWPSGSTRNASPVCSHWLRHADTVASGMPW